MTDNLAEKDPTFRNNSPAESGWSNGTYTKEDLNAMYGFGGETSSEDDGTIAVGDLGTEGRFAAPNRRSLFVTCRCR